MHERRRGLRDAVDRTAVGVEQKRTGPTALLAELNRSQERYDPGRRQRSGEIVRSTLERLPPERPAGLGRERKWGDDPEVAAPPAAKGPEEIAVLLRRATNGSPRAKDHPSRAEPVAGEAELARRKADTTAQRQPGDPDRRATACRN